MMWLADRVVRAFAALAGALLVTLAAPAPAGAARIAFADWFNLDQEATADWSAQGVPGDPLSVAIKPRQPSPSQAIRRIMVLYPRGSSAYDTAMSKFLEVLADKRINAEVRVVNFKTENARGRAALADAEANKFDLVLSMGSESTAWLWTNYAGGRLPVVTVCSKDPVLLGQAKDYASGSGTNFAFTSLNMPIDVQMAYVMKLKPGLKNLAVLVDATNTSAVQTQARPVIEFATARGTRAFEVAVTRPDRVRQELPDLVRNAVSTMTDSDPTLADSMFWITGSTILFDEIGTINANAGRVPVLSAVIDVVRPGDASAVLSVGISFESNAHLAAIYAADLLEGRGKIGAMKVGVVSPPDVAVSFRRASEIGMRIPFPLLEAATTVYDTSGKLVRSPSGEAERH